MSCPASVYNNAPEHRAQLIDAAENKIKWCSRVSVRLRRSPGTVPQRGRGWRVRGNVGYMWKPLTW